MLQLTLQLLRMGIEQTIKRRFGVESLSLLGNVRNIANVQQLKKIFETVSKVHSAEDLKKLIQGPPPQAPPPL